LGLGLALLSAEARALSDKDIPEPLRPWKAWVLHGHEEINCPALHDNAKKRLCAWPGRLELMLDDAGGRFAQSWQVYKKGWAALPGDAKRWPKDLRVDGEPAIVTDRGGAPSIYLDPGKHRVEGTFAWKQLPQSLRVPRTLGLLTLAINDKPVTFPELDSKGTLWLGERRGGGGKKGTVQDTLSLQIFRHVDDDLPMRVTTRVKLDVSGRHREILFGPAMLDGFVPLALNAPLPVRLEPDGRLRVQARPGNWIIDLVARHPGPVDALARPKQQTAPWPKSEVWAFNAHNDLRLVEVTGAPGIDPRQTTLPPVWRKLPAYVVGPGTKLAFTTKRRGNPDPAPDQLQLKRTLWLDFDGGGYTARDTINGTMRAGWRLEMAPPFALGRVAVNGKDQFITRADGSDKVGVELRKGRVKLIAESRIDQKSRSLDAVGWDHDMRSLNMTLYLPPGWRAFHVTGADRVSTTWLQRWSMLDLFLVLIIALAMGRLWGWPWGAVALATLALTYHEPDAPRWVWLNILGAVALLRVVPEGIFRKLIGLYRNGALLALIIIALPFVIGQVRIALYPQLERSWQYGSPSRITAGNFDGEMASAVRSAPSAKRSLRKRAKSLERKLDESAGAAGYSLFSSLQRVDPAAQIQTGPGIPTWNRRAVRLHWNGPVKRDQAVGLTLLPPFLSGALRFLGVLLIGALSMLMLASRFKIPLPFIRTTAAALVIGVVAALAGSPSAMAAETPDPAMLEELRKRLLETPKCFPHCAQLPSLDLDIKAEGMTARMTVHAAEDVAVPLPGDDRFWRLRQVLLDGKPVGAMRLDGKRRLWVHVSKGRHTIEMDGVLADAVTLPMPFTLRPHRVTWQAEEGWIVDGVDENGVPGAQLQLSRPRQRAGAPTKTFEPSRMPAFARIERTLALGLDWRVHTRVIRDRASRGAITLKVPLLDGESVTTENARVENGTVLVNMTPAQREFRWTATLDRRPDLVLAAPTAAGWVETWQLDASPIWHVASAGLAPVFHQDPRGVWRPKWRPWPGEKLTLKVTRPEGVEGQTLTIDRSKLELRPGQRATDATLTLGLRSSQGGQHTIRLPKDVSLESVKINNRLQPVRARDGIVTLPVTPGKQSIVLQWQSKNAIGARFVTPDVALGTPSVNSRIEIRVPRERWVLFAAGPKMGPAVLFWGVLLVVAAIAAGLGRTSITPLKWYHWLLLGVGLTQAPVPVAILIVGWLLALGGRTKLPESTGKTVFNFVQATLAVLTLASLAGLVFAVQQGLLGTPEMQVSGNGSSAHMLRWYQDRVGDTLPTASVISVSIWFYRFLMLAWALWLAYMLLRWLRWGWDCFATNELWRPFSLAFWRRWRRAPDAPATDG
jgi:hypothetical protein